VATLGTIDPIHLSSGTAAAPEWLVGGTIWRLSGPVNLHSQPQGPGLATQAWAGRHLQILDPDRHASTGRRLRVRLLEDGYPGWIDPTALLGRAVASGRPQAPRLQRSAIVQRLPQVLTFAKAARSQANTYLWGGSLGPDYDCSGLVQRAFASAGIWIPRDAYLQERFCQPVAVQAGQIQLLAPGDLIFFGTAQRCTHVGLHLGGGRYLHSSGAAHGHNGIGIDDLAPHNLSPVARHYRQELRGAGRVMHSHDGSPLPA
jgi:cell wall-associated NlpC family hydrolase